MPDREHVHVRLPPAGSDVVCLCRANRRGSCLLPPSPACDLRHIVPVPGDECLVIDELVADGLLGIGGPWPELRHAVDHVAYEVEAIEIIQHAHVERCRGGSAGQAQFDTGAAGCGGYSGFWLERDILSSRQALDRTPSKVSASA